MTIHYKEDKDIALAQLINLYEDADWSSYTKNHELLDKAIRNSAYVLSAWENEKLVGLIRVISDDATIIYIQDILVLSGYKRRKIGTTLVKTVLNKYSDIRQKVLITDESPVTRGFYESVGFLSCDNYQMTAFINVKKRGM
ncbi:MAG: GNAT family N-acetyltransferase [Clostridia bacterium]|nr:GNAT family N-acetyltransferase [Clostridia bacterium]